MSSGVEGEDRLRDEGRPQRQARSNSPGEGKRPGGAAAFGPGTTSPAHPGRMRNVASVFFLHVTLTVRLFLFPILLSSGMVAGMTGEKTTRELIYETNRDVKWICKTLQRMKAQDEAFEAQLWALEGGEWRGSTLGAGAGGVVGGVAVLVRVLGGGWGMVTSTPRPARRRSFLGLVRIYQECSERSPDILPLQVGYRT